MPALQHSLFIKSVDDYASRYLKNTDPIDPRLIKADGLLEALKVAEGLLISPKLTLKVYGENVVLAHLITALGLKTVEQLLEEKALEFILWDQIVTFMDAPELLEQGLHPLQSGVMHSGHNIYPLESAETGLKWAYPKLSRSERRRIARLAAKCTILPRKNISHEAVRLITRAYEGNDLAPLGFPADRPMHHLRGEQLRQLANLSEQALEVAALVDKSLDLYQDENTWNAYRQLFASIPSHGQVIKTAETVLSLERIPSIPSLLLGGIINFQDLPKIRNLKETQEFRQWLWSQDAVTDTEAVSQAYLAAMSPRVNIKDQTWFKIARISVMGVLGSLAGLAVAGPAGGVAGFALSTGGGVAVSLIDGLMLDQLGKNANPRKFSTDVLSPLIAQNALHSQSKNPRA